MTINIYLLDANYLISLLDETRLPDIRRPVLEDFRTKLNDDSSRFVLTPLIRYEVLRGVSWNDEEKFQRMEKALSGFELLEITQAVADLARDLYRFDYFEARQKEARKEEARQKKEIRNFEKRKFDIFHYATAYVYQLKFLSADKGFSAIEALHQRMEAAQKN